MSRTSTTMATYQVLVMSCVVASVLGHGRVLDPPSRATAWRYNFTTAKDYEDTGTNCGGREHQHYNNGGKCGVCGDPYDAPTPRPHELGGIYGQGVIVKTYTTSLIDITVELTASHMGFWEFNICPDPKRNDQECFDRFPLELKTGGTKYHPTRGNGKYPVTYILPRGLVCDHCVLQWRYTAGNNPDYQEHFGACSDISIQKPGHKRLEDNAIRDDNQKKLKPYPLMKNNFKTQHGGKQGAYKPLHFY